MFYFNINYNKQKINKHPISQVTFSALIINVILRYIGRKKDDGVEDRLDIARELTHPMFWSVAKFLSGISIPVDFPSPPESRFIPVPLVFFFSISWSASLPLLQIYYHPAGNITAVFIAARGKKTTILLSPPSIKRILGSLILSRREASRGRGKKLWGLLFRTDSRMGNQLYHCYDRASTVATWGGYVRPGAKTGRLRECISLL